MVKEIVQVPRVLYGINHGSLTVHLFEGFLHAFIKVKPFEKSIEDPTKKKFWFGVIDKGIRGSFVIFAHG
jgi:hypothetical protein